jgi:hypothetical protein
MHQLDLFDSSPLTPLPAAPSTSPILGLRVELPRDIRERLALYAGREVEVRRIALNLDQVRQYNPPPNFADTRFAAQAVWHLRMLGAGRTQPDGHCRSYPQ